MRTRDSIREVWEWSRPEEAFDHFKELSRGRPCDYSGLSYAKLSGGSGIKWPCNEAYPEGKARLYTDHVFNTDPAKQPCFKLTAARIRRVIRSRGPDPG